MFKRGWGGGVGVGREGRARGERNRAGHFSERAARGQSGRAKGLGLAIYIFGERGSKRSASCFAFEKTRAKVVDRRKFRGEEREGSSFQARKHLSLLLSFSLLSSSFRKFGGKEGYRERESESKNSRSFLPN